MRASAAERAHRKLKRDLLSGALQPGDRIVVEDVCARLGMSRTPVREALVALAREGLVQVIPRRGYFARQISFRDALDAYQLRVILEPITAALAAQRITPEEISTLRDLALVTADGTVRGVARAVEENRAFHVLIAKASGNVRLSKIIDDLMDDIERLVHTELTVQHTEVTWSGEHMAIVDALEAHDPSAAAAAVRATFAQDTGLLPARAKAELADLVGSQALGHPVSEGGFVEVGARRPRSQGRRRGSGRVEPSS